MTSDHCLVIAHRGASAYTDGNTLEAFDLAIEQGADAVEMDVRITSEGKLIILHNPNIRKGMRRHRISKRTIPQLSTVYGKDMLLLEDVVKRLGKKVMLDLDIKDKGCEEQLSTVLHAINIPSSKVFINCSKFSVLQSIRAVLPDAQMVLSFSILDGYDLSKRKLLQGVFQKLSIGIRRIILQRFKRRAVKHKVYGVSLPHGLVYPALVQYFHKHNIRVYAWPPEGEKTFKRLIAMGVDGIKTGRPDVLSKVLKDVQ